MKKVMCTSCKGSGFRQEYLHIEGGKCYPCGGLGYTNTEKGHVWNKLIYVRPNSKAEGKEEKIEIRIHKIDGEAINGFVYPYTRSRDVWNVIGAKHERAYFDREYPEEVFEGADVIRMWVTQFVSNGFSLLSNEVM